MAKKKKTPIAPATKTSATKSEETGIKAVAVTGDAALEATLEPTFPAITDPEPEVTTTSVIETIEETVPTSIPSVAQHTVTYEEIARRAYDIAVARGGAPGHELEDWLQAEQSLGVVHNA